MVVERESGGCFASPLRWKVSEMSNVHDTPGNDVQHRTSKGFDPVNQRNDEADTGTRNEKTYFEKLARINGNLT